LAWQTVRTLSPVSSPQKIIEVEASGITGAEEIAKAAIKRLGLPGAPRSSESQGT